MPLLTLAMYVLITTRTSSELSQLIDNLLSGRVILGTYAYDTWGLSMFGQNIDYSTPTNLVYNIAGFTFDNVYTYLMMQLGFIYIVIISVLFAILARRSNNKVNIFIILWGLYGIIETHVMNAFNCFPIILISLLQNYNSKSGAT